MNAQKRLKRQIVQSKTNTASSGSVRTCHATAAMSTLFVIKRTSAKMTELVALATQGRDAALEELAKTTESALKMNANLIETVTVYLNTACSASALINHAIALESVLRLTSVQQQEYVVLVTEDLVGTTNSATTITCVWQQSVETMRIAEEQISIVTMGVTLKIAIFAQQESARVRAIAQRQDFAIQTEFAEAVTRQMIDALRRPHASPKVCA